jgi:hypothetical protein
VLVAVVPTVVVLVEVVISEQKFSHCANDGNNVDEYVSGPD